MGPKFLSSIKPISISWRTVAVIESRRRSIMDEGGKECVVVRSIFLIICTWEHTTLKEITFAIYLPARSQQKRIQGVVLYMLRLSFSPQITACCCFLVSVFPSFSSAYEKKIDKTHPCSWEQFFLLPQAIFFFLNQAGAKSFSPSWRPSSTGNMCSKPSYDECTDIDALGIAGVSSAWICWSDLCHYESYMCRCLHSAPRPDGKRFDCSYWDRRSLKAKLTAINLSPTENKNKSRKYSLFFI